MTTDGDALYFQADDGTHGDTLWTSDGTAAGTRALTETSVAILGAFDHQLLFAASDADHGSELWRTDGTVAGTTLLKDINPGPAGSTASNGVVAGHRLFFTANDGSHGRELWVSDGTAAGTHITADLTTTSGGAGSTGVYALAASGDDVYFNGFVNGAGGEPYVSDGTEAGTRQVAELESRPYYSSDPRSFVPFDGETYFLAANGAGDHLYATDGTPGGTTLIKTINSSEGHSQTETLTVAGDALFFGANGGNGDGTELWTSDGTTAGTQEVANINPGGNANPELITAAGSTVYFQADDGTDGVELWASDGTAGGTNQVKDINSTGSSSPTDLLWDGTDLWFQADDGSHGPEAWTTDGTAAGTTSEPLNTTATSTITSSARAGGKLVSILQPATGNPQLVVSDGTAAGTHTLSTSFTALSSPASVGGKVYFSGSSTVAQRNELWVTDGTEAGTQVVADVAADYGPYASGGKLFFVSQSGASSAQLWTSDGTAAGTVQVTDETSTASVTNVTPFRGGVAFGAEDADSRQQAWISDGTTAGTRALRIPGVDETAPDSFGVLGDTLFFTGSHASPVSTLVAGTDELYASDGTDAGTHAVGSGLGDGTPRGWTAAGGKLYYLNEAGADGLQLYVTDGTAAGTHEVEKLGDGQYYQGPRDLTAVGGKLAFTVADLPGVWVTDGSAAGTTQLAAAAGETAALRRVGDRVYFAGFDDAHGTELWATDGSAAGTGLITDLVSGAGSSHPQVAGDVDGKAIALGDAPGSGAVLYGIDAPPAPPAGGDDGGSGSDGGDGPTSTTPTTTTTQTTPAVTTTTTTTTPAPAPAPAPAKTADARRATSVTLAVAKPGAGVKPPFRWVVSGRVTVPKGVAKAKACTGTVTVTARRGDAVVARATTELTTSCTYSVTVSKATYKRLAARGGKLVLVARFAGNAALLPARSQEASVRYGGR